ncbi:hypothetical protein [Streptomyces sp. NRRL S-337]|uniref:hypothetical protein n=1 Tax=Streptomyces sp. NRRL S-337 TaxID=1463900 RepID=UPI0004C8D31A|nr:hypothetical protein [Streptomyces sp. NRRL S-337]
MKLSALAAGYQKLLAAAEAISPAAPLLPDVRADLDWRLCHIALSDRIIVTAAHKTLAGKAAVVDNQAAMDSDQIGKMVTATSHTERVDAVRRNAAELLDALRRFSSDETETSVELRIYNREGEHVSDSWTSWQDLIALRAEKHIPGHTDQLVGYQV